MKDTQDFKGEHQFVIFSSSFVFCGISILCEAFINGVVYYSKPTPGFGLYVLKFEVPSELGWILIVFGLLLYIYTTRKVFFRVYERIKEYNNLQKFIAMIKFIFICIMDAVLGVLFCIAAMILREI